MKFYDAKELVDKDTPSKISLWVEKEGKMYSIWSNGRISMPHYSRVTKQSLQTWGVKEVSPEYAMRFFEEAQLSLDQLYIAYEE